MWGKRGGVGFSDLIYDQLIDRFGALVGKGKITKPHGPLPMTEQANSSVTFRRTGQANPQDLNLKISPKEGRWPSLDLKSPWAGTLLSKQSLGNEENLLEIRHENGLLGKYVFKGMPAQLAERASLAPGQLLGRISPDSGALYWNLRADSPEAEKSLGE